MSTETQKIDVLAVMDAEIADLAEVKCSDEQKEYELRLQERNMRQVRAAVAELIESITVLSSYCDVTEMDPENEKDCATLSNHWRRVENALARVGGAA